MLLLKAFLQDEPLTSRSKSTGSNGELYRPYLEQSEKEVGEEKLTMKEKHQGRKDTPNKKIQRSLSQLPSI